jgi:hypothetical protein
VFQDPNKKDYFRIPEPMYDAVVNAYAQKIDNDVHFNDLRRMQASLEPLNERAVMQHKGNVEHVTVELRCYLSEDKNDSESHMSDNTQTLKYGGEEITDYRDLITKYN